MFRQADNTVFESDLPVQFEILLQPSELIEDDITVQIITISNTAVDMYICMYVLVCSSVCVCVCMYVCPPPRLLITRGMMWCDMKPI